LILFKNDVLSNNHTNVFTRKTKTTSFLKIIDYYVIKTISNTTVYKCHQKSVSFEYWSIHSEKTKHKNTISAHLLEKTTSFRQSENVIVLYD